MAENEISDYLETDSDNTDIAGISVQENIMRPPAVNNAFRALQGALKRWFKSSLFRLRDGSDQTKLLSFNLSNITTATTRTLTVPDKNGTIALTSDIPAPNRGYLFGLTLSNNTSDATNDIDVAVGEAASEASTPVLLTLASTMTKRLDAAWAAGTGNGGLMSAAALTNAWYFVYIIKNPTTGVVDVGFDASPTAPNYPSGFTQYRRIGAIERAGGSIRQFRQLGDEFLYFSPTEDVTVTNLGAPGVLYTLRVPLGIKTDALITAAMSNASSNRNGLLTSPEQSDDAPGNTGQIWMPVANQLSSAALRIRTNTSAQIRARSDNTNTTLRIQTNGFVDQRGRLS